ncbi:MAG: hypothetical protein NTV19_06705 [Burkholderiales bacterium]|nr:hypothetical protein [Burkholderiales bacterium]
MTNSFGMGSMGLGPLGNLLDSVDLVKKAWSNFNLPSSLTPTMDVEELDKRIADLKTVEQWLNVNLSMLRGTIQGMEVQRGTLAAIKAFGQSVMPNAEGLAAMAAAAAQAAGRAASAPPESSAPPPGAQAAFTAQPSAAPPAPDSSPASAPQSQADTAQSESSIAAELSRAAAAAVNPGAWWNLLQSQFNELAKAAISGARQDGEAAAEPVATDTGKPRRAARPRARQAAAEPAPAKTGKTTAGKRQARTSGSGRAPRTKGF